MDLEQWVIDLFNSIKVASELEAGFELKLDIEAVKKITSAYDETKWIEIY